MVTKFQLKELIYVIWVHMERTGYVEDMDCLAIVALILKQGH